MSCAAVIPAYNAERTIRETIDSILAQTRQANEIIVMDDGSKDGTRAAVESYGPRVRFVQQANQGPSIARNRGAELAQSQLIAYLDADDLWEPRKLERQMQVFADHPDTVLSYTSLLMLQPGGTQRIHEAVAPESLPRLLRLSNPNILPSCVMLPREIMLASGGFPARLRIGEDWDLWLRLLKLGPFRAVNEPLTRYRVSHTGLSSNAEFMLSEARSMVEGRLLDGLTGVDRWLWRRRILSYQEYRAALTARAAGEHDKELRYMAESIATWPSPFFEPDRLKVMAVTLRNAMRRRSAQV